MNLFPKRLVNICVALFILTFLFSNTAKAQTTLVKGDIAFTGLIGNGVVAGTDQFSFVLLTPITAGTVIKFTDNAWLRTSPTTGSFRTGEGTMQFTSVALPAGTEIYIQCTASPTATYSGGSAGTVTNLAATEGNGAAMSFSANGDQIIAYQGTSAAPTFISAIHMNVYSVASIPPDIPGGDPVTTTVADWDGAVSNANASGLPGLTGSNFLTTGVDAIWIPGSIVAEVDNARFNCTGPLTTAAEVRAAIYNVANWITNNDAPSFTLPTGCAYITAPAAPTFTLQPANSIICVGANTSFTITATGAVTYQWQVDNGGGFTNITNNATYSGATSTTLNITAVPISFNTYSYRCVATNGGGSTNSNSATLTVNALPVNPTLLAKTPATGTVADGTPVSATFNAGSGGTGCADDYRYTTNGGASYLPYTPGSNISTTGLAAGSGIVFIEGRRANCTSPCQNNYQVLASWVVSPLPAIPSSLNAGDIAFSGYLGFGTGVSVDEFSFVLLRNIGPGTVIRFTNNGWLSTNVFRTGEEEVTWTSPATALPAGTEIKIVGTTASKAGGGAAGTVTGTPLSLSANGDQILAYRGTAATPTFISAIHTNVYTTANGDPVTTTAAAWDGTANTTNASALPTGLATGITAIWIGTQGDINSEFDNARFGNCALPAVAGSISALRSALNNQANWSRSNGDPAGFTLPTNCNYLSALAPSINVTGTPLSAFTSCTGTASAEQSFTVDGSALTADIILTAPAGFEISITSGSGFTSSITLTQSGGTVPSTPIYVRMTAAATGTPSGNITVASTGVTTVDVAVTGTASTPPTTANAGSDASICSLTYTLAGNIPTSGTGTWSQVSGPGTSTFVNANLATSDVTVSVQGVYVFRWSIATAAPCLASTDDVQITFASTPTTANAGADRNLCQPSSSLSMAANTPSFGTGTWTQIGGPVTATITNINNPTTSVTGLNTIGTYTFVWTITNAPCIASTDTMTISVGSLPAAFSIVGATVCQGSIVTLSGPANPNYTYTWQRSLSGIINSYTTFGGTAQTQDVTTSGNYQLVVTNQFGCTASDTAIVHMADYRFTGSLAAGDASQTGRINRLAQTSVCPGPKAFPGMFATTGARLYDSYTITNIRAVPVCATVGIASGCGVNMFNVAYSGSFNPADPSQNYLGDPGSSFPASGFMEITIPANGTIVLVVHEVNPGAGCANYTLTVEVPRDPAAITVTPTLPVCSGTSTTLTAPVASSYLWNPGGATTQAITITPTINTTYDVTLGYGNVGCTNNIDTLITINPVATANAGPDDAVCGLTYAAFAANTPVIGTGAWSQVSGPGTSTFTNSASPTSGVTVTTNGIYVFRWTVTAAAPCVSSAQDDVIINLAGNPTVANAGVDRTACVNPGSTTLTGNTPTVGTGSWSQVAGPVTANIISSNLATTIITGLNTIGTYTFRWTISNAPCTASFDEVNVVVNGNPVGFSITGGGTFCPTGTTLAGPVDPNYTYQWGKSYLAAPFAPVGTGQTLAVTTSGIYQLTVTNQFGCNTSATTVVNAADYVFNGSLAAGDATQTGRLNRFANISTCAAPKACPLTFTTTGSRLYDSYTITNPRNVPVCAVIGLNSGCGTAVFSAAYLGSYNPTSLCTNYLADPGSSPATSIFYEATIPANGTIVVVVHEVNPGQGCANYTLTVDLPRDLSPITAVPPTVTCAGTTTLTAPVANSYSWNPGGATTQSIVTPPLFVDTKFYATMGYGNNGCNRLDSITVMVTSLPPTIACPANITQNNTTGQCGRMVTYTTTVGGTPTPTETYTFTGATTGSGTGNGSGSFFNVGTTTVTVTATNACGSVNCSFTVTINDNESPVVTTGTIASCYPTVAAAEAAALAATSATDNCPGALTEVASTVGTCSAVITVRTTDVAGNFTDVTYNTRIDNIAPIVTVGTIGSCYPTVAAAEAAALAATSATDNCTGALTEVASTVGTCSAVITVTTTDACGNSTAVTYNTRIDNTPPVITCPAPITVCGSAAVPAPNTGLVTVTDNCPGAITVIHVGDVSTPNPNAPYIVTRTYRATDGCGNVVECTQLITVNPIPSVDPVANQVLCNGATTTPVNFTGPVSGTIFNWTNSDPTIGLAASGTGNIGAFTAVNTGNTPVVATVTVTPIYSGSTSCIPSTTTFTNNTPTVIPTGPAVVTSTISVSGAPVYLTELSVLTNLTHTFAADLDITITAPSGRVVTLTTDNGAGNDNVFNGTLWRDKANPAGQVPYTTNNGVVTDHAYVNLTTANPLTPEEPLGAFIGENPNGTWTITISDDLAGDGGSLNSWALNVEGLSSAPIIATTSVTQSTPVAIPTGPAVVTSTVVVSGAGSILHDVNLTTFLTHTFAADLDITLTSPAGTVVTLTSDNGAGNDNVFNGTVWDDNANPGGTVPYTTNNGMVTDHAYVNLTLASPLAPEEPLAAFRGENPNGTWTITISDDLAGDGGSLNSWTLDLQTATCASVTCTGTPITYTYTVNPTPIATATPSTQTICSGDAIAPIVLTSTVTGTTYTWTRDNVATVTGITASGSGNISGTLTNTTPLPVTVTFTITPTSPQGCVGLPITATVIVNPRPVMTVTPAAQTICNGVTITPIVFASTTPGTTYTWIRDNTSTTTAPGGIPASGSGPSITGFMINTTNAPITVTFTITPTAAGCVGTPVTATVTIQPTTTAIATPAFQVSCSGIPIIPINFTSPVVGTVFRWTRDNVATATGIPANGTGNITGTLTTTLTTPVTVTFTIIPSINGCDGPAIIAVDTVRPTPSVNTPANQTLCNGVATTAVSFTSPVPGTVFNWTNNTPSIGLAASGSGNIASFTATNTGNTPVTATITITPVAAGCPGASVSFTITVNPTAVVNAIPNQTLCTGQSTAAINFSSPTSGTVNYSWTNNTPSIGLPASGTGNIPSFVAVNNTPNAVTATITVTPNTAAGCVGTARTFTITVNGNSVAPTGATSSVTANCGPTSTTLTVQGGALGTGATWRWYSGSCGGTLVGTGASITIPVNVTTTYFVRAEGTCNTTTCASVTVTINEVPTISIAAAPFTALTPLLRTTLTATVTPTTSTNTIEWFKDNGVFPVGTGLTLSNINVDQVGSYRARITTAQGCTALSNIVDIRDSVTSQLFVYPNPNNGQFKIRYYIPENVISVVRRVAIFDSKGALVFNKPISVQTRWGAMDINIRGVAQGDYFIKILDVNERELVGARVAILR